jgi:hypothetical protein
MPNLLDPEKYYEEARHRATRRKSPWNLILIPLCGGSAIAIAYGLFRAVWLFHTVFYPSHELSHFWRRGITARSLFLSFLMVFAPALGSIPMGFMIGNLLAWLIPPARRTFDSEAQGFPDTGFLDSMRGLLRLAAWTLPPGVFIALAAAYFLTSLR